MTDRLDAITALLNAPRLPAIDRGDVAWLVAEVRRLRDRRYNRDVEMVERLRLAEADLAEERQEHRATLQMAADLRQRHAEAVEAAFREAHDYGVKFGAYLPGVTAREPLDADAAWLASEAKARLT